MIATYSAVSNIITDSTTPRIAILVNSIDKPLEICKDIHLNIIYKFVEIVYFLIDVSKVVITLVITIITLSEPLL